MVTVVGRYGSHSLFKNCFHIGTIFWLENLKGRDHLEDLGVDGNIILKWTLGK